MLHYFDSQGEALYSAYSTLQPGSERQKKDLKPCRSVSIGTGRLVSTSSVNHHKPNCVKPLLELETGVESQQAVDIYLARKIACGDFNRF